MPSTITVRPWPDPVIDTLGHDARSMYAEVFWLPTLGPSTVKFHGCQAENFISGSEPRFHGCQVFGRPDGGSSTSVGRRR